jgi:3-oxo-5alpha-steroid 4-dehydrogenase
MSAGMTRTKLDDGVWPAGIEPAQRLERPEAIAWDDEADVIVVGYGGAGVIAALEAAAAGLSVLALDRYGGGGATRINGGVYYAGGGTRIQVEAGVTDSVQDMFDYLSLETQGVVTAPTLRRFCQDSAANLDWLAANGVPFNARLYAKKTSYPPSDYYLYHSDSSLAGRYAEKTPPAARGHRVFMPAANRADGYGAGFYDPLRATARERGVRDWNHAQVQQLIQDGQGRVVGVKALRIAPDLPQAAEHQALLAAAHKWQAVPAGFPGGKWAAAKAEKLLAKAAVLKATHARPLRLRARHGVVLSAGGFVYNRAMIQRHAPKYLAGMPLGTPGDDGAGIALGVSAGGAMTGMERMSAWRFINPPQAWARGMIVDASGARYVDETLYGAAIGQEMCERHGGKAYLILDQALYRQAWKDVSQKGVLPFQKYPAMLVMALGRKKAATLPALAARCGFDAEIFAEAAAAYNRLADGAQVDQFGKRASDAGSVRQGPYYALDMSVDAPLAPLPTLTLGGLSVDEVSGQVRDEAGRGIEGLYAAGRTALGVCSNLYVSGLAVADCVFSGRRAGAAIADRAGRARSLAPVAGSG